MRRGWTVGILAVCVAGVLWASPAAAQKKSVAEEILDILRANGQISEAQYELLLNKTRAEEERASESWRMASPPPRDTKAVPGVREGYRLGRGFTFESSDGNYSLALGGRFQGRFTYLDRDGEVSGRSDEGEFRLRRARLYWRGYAFSPKLQYTGELDAAPGEVELLNLEMAYAYRPDLSLMVGQFKPPQARQELTSSGSLQFVDRSLANDFFNLGRDRGAQVYGMLGEYLFEYRAGIFNGNGLNTRQTSTDFLYAGRLTLNPLGPFPYDEPDFARTPNLLASFGISTQFNKVGKKDISRLSDDNDSLEFLVIRPKFTGDNIDIWTSTADVAAKWRGFSFLGEYYRADVSTPLAFNFGSGTNNRSFNAWGLNLQAGYFLIPRKLEVAFRYGIVDPEDNALNFEDQDEMRGGVSYYFDQHNLKLQADVGNLGTARKGRKDIDDLEVRAQLQIIF